MSSASAGQSPALTVVGAYEAKTHFSALLEQVAAGERITITRHGTPLAQLVPIKVVRTAQQRREAIDRIAELRSGTTLGNLTIRDLIEEGRR